MVTSPPTVQGTGCMVTSPLSEAHDTRPVQSSPVQSSPVQSSQAQSSPVHSSPVQSSPVQSRCGQAPVAPPPRPPPPGTGYRMQGPFLPGAGCRAQGAGPAGATSSFLAAAAIRAADARKLHEAPPGCRVQGAGCRVQGEGPADERKLFEAPPSSCREETALVEIVGRLARDCREETALVEIVGRLARDCREETALVEIVGLTGPQALLLNGNEPSPSPITHHRSPITDHPRPRPHPHPRRCCSMGSAGGRQRVGPGSRIQGGRPPVGPGYRVQGGWQLAGRARAALASTVPSLARSVSSSPSSDRGGSVTPSLCPVPCTT